MSNFNKYPQLIKVMRRIFLKEKEDDEEDILESYLQLSLMKFTQFPICLILKELTHEIRAYL